MTQLVCPLCGRFVGVEHFDPRFFEDDIYGVDVRGLGRGRGFEVTNTYSLMGDPRITGLIADRCHRILHIINDKGYIPPQELDALRATLESWIQYTRKLETEIAKLHEENKKLSEINARVQRERLESAQITINDDDDEEETLAMEEMQEILDRINASASSDFEYLSDAVGFLLEVG